MPKLNRYQRKQEPQAIEAVQDPVEQKRIRQTIKATEGYIMLSCIAMGLIQLIALTFSGEIRKDRLRYSRTPSKSIVSEAR